MTKSERHRSSGPGSFCTPPLWRRDVAVRGSPSAEGMAECFRVMRYPILSAIVFEVPVDSKSFTGRYCDTFFTRVGYVNDFWITALVASFRIGLMNGDFMDITWMHSVCGDFVDIWWTSLSRPDWALDQHKKK